jgi:two-component system, LytTR family, sensor kinase
MKRFVKYFGPALYGLLVYTTIRIINDTVAEFEFWKRDWKTTAIEILSTIVIGYTMFAIFGALFRRFDQQPQRTVGYKSILRELGWIFITTEICVNAIGTTTAALTDDGMSWGDFATINIIPLLFNIIYYAITRTQQLLRAYINSKLELEQLTNDHLQTELKFLKAQYHPHFLFNALNTVYFQMDEDVGAAKKSIEKFSELLRYQLYDQQQTVPVSQEIHYLQNFIALQKVRSSEKLQLTVDFDDRLDGQQVYPLLFLPLVENAFKYVGGNYHMNIAAATQDRGIIFEVENAVPANIPVKKQNGIGLENLQRRLALLYPGRHELVIDRKEGSFRASLKIELN